MYMEEITNIYFTKIVKKKRVKTPSKRPLLKPAVVLCYIYVSIPEVIKACLYYKCYINVKGFYPSFFWLEVIKYV